MADKSLSIKFIERKIRNLAKLSTLPFVASRVMEMVENPRTSASQLCEIISTDQVMAARILRLANSAYYGFPRKISTLNLAIVVLGFNALRDLVLSISLIDRFALQNKEIIDLKQFWRHVLIVGIGSKLLAKYLNYPIIGEVFVGGLLHDIGYLVMYQHFPEEFNRIYEFAKTNNISFDEAGRIELGVSHTEMGAWLAEGWNLPHKLVQSIKYHHLPSKSLNYQDLISFIYLADLISYSIDEGNGILTRKEISESEIENLIKELFPRSRYSLKFFQNKFIEEVEKIEEFLAILDSN